MTLGISFLSIYICFNFFSRERIIFYSRKISEINQIYLHFSLIYTKSGGLNLWKAKIRRQVLQLIFLLRVFGEFGHFVLCKKPGNQIFRPNLFLFEQIPEYKLILPTNTFEFPPVIRQEKYRLHFDISSLSPFSCV